MSDDRGRRRSLGRWARAASRASAATAFLFACLGESLAVAVFAFLPTLSAGALIHAVAGLGLVAAVGGDPGRRPGPDGRRGWRGRRLAIALASIAAVAAIPAARIHLAALPFALAAALLAHVVRRFHARWATGREPAWTLVPWAAAAYLGCWLLTANALFLLPPVVAWRRRATFRALRRAATPDFRAPLGAAFAMGVVLALPHLAEPDPEQCLDAQRSAAPVAVADGVTTIALLGDSSTEGFFLPGAASYGAVLEQLLNQVGQPPRFRVVNCGLRGATSADLEAQLALALAYRPALVSAYVGYNDQTGYHGHEAAPRAARLRANLARFIEAAHASGARPILITPPSGRTVGRLWVDEVRAVELELGRTTGADLVDARAAFRSRRFPPRYFVADQVHPNAGGHVLVARLLAEKIEAMSRAGR